MRREQRTRRNDGVGADPGMIADERAELVDAGVDRPAVPAQTDALVSTPAMKSATRTDMD
jgi:hypothetical protein